MKLFNYANQIIALQKQAKVSWICLIVAGLSMLLFSSAAFGQGAAAVTSCESLAKLALPDTTITRAETIAPGEYKFPPQVPGSQGLPRNKAKELPAFCLIEASVKPSNDSNITIEVWLPPTGWNGKLESIGNGNWGGRISHAGLIEAVLRGYAAASSDSGHDVLKPEEDGAGFALGHPEKVVDLGYRAEHEMTVKAKAIIKAFYGVTPKHSYFYGSRLGGFQGLTEAKRYPEDYDGIIAEAPINSLTLSTIQSLWANWLVAQDKSRFIPQSKAAMVQQAMLKECDELDGVKDGQMENPLICNFDPKVLLCKGADAPDCLTAAQVEYLDKVHQGPVNPRTGKVIVPGPALGGEFGGMPPGAKDEPRPVSPDFFRNMVYQDPKWDVKTLDWDKDVNKAIEVTGPALSVDSNLKAFFDHGGKMLMSMSWRNYSSPQQLFDYYNDMVKKIGANKAATSLRLFTTAGSSWEAPYDSLNVLEDWVEKGKVPDSIIASYKKDGKVYRTRPLCAYPKVAQYKGTGSTDEAANFVCAEGKTGSPKR